MAKGKPTYPSPMITSFADRRENFWRNALVISMYESDTFHFAFVRQVDKYGDVLTELVLYPKSPIHDYNQIEYSNSRSEKTFYV